jgi:ribosome-binding ATPase
MSVSCGLVGMPLSGKTTIFNLLTQANASISEFYSGKTETNQGTAFIPDSRIDFLNNLYNPRKKTYAKIDFTDVPGLKKDAGNSRRSGNQFLASIRESDALIYVLRAFVDGEVEHVEGTIDPLRDWNIIEMELLIADLDVIERNIERIQHGKKITKESQLLLDTLDRCRQVLEEGAPIHTLILSEEEKDALQGYSFFTQKPYMVLVNVDEEQLMTGNYPTKEAMEKKAAELEIPLIELSAKIEAEIGQLTIEDRAMFLEELSITEPGIHRLAQATYELLGLISFFTVGEDEVRAWTIEKGINARSAAGKIHSDIEKGFIRAEVVAYHDIERCGNAHKAKEQGLYRLEGKEYIVRDGDIINFRFNI